MRLMNEVLVEFIRTFVRVYLDDILIFSHTREEYLKHIDMVLKRLHEEKLMINLDKCLFMQEEIIYLGFVISQGEFKMDQEKVSAILSWPTPKTMNDVWSFHGLETFYRKFIRGFSHVCAPMLDTIKGGQKCRFSWTKEADDSFETLKKKVAEQPVLALPDFNKIFQVECDASHMAIGLVLS